MKTPNPNPETQFLKLLPPDKRDVPCDVIADICQSLINAKQAMKKADLEDLIHGFATVDDPEPEKRNPSLRLAMLDQIDKGNGPTRYAYARKTKKPIRENEWIRDLWILRNWLTFQDKTTIEGIEDIGLCDLEDEVAASVIQDRFDCGEYSRKIFRRFRDKHQLRQVPQKLKIRGIRKNTRGCYHLGITAIGQKPI